MVPVFRLPWEVIQRDVDRILDLGVKLELNHPITSAPEELLEQGFDAVYVATGFQREPRSAFPASKGKGCAAALTLLDLHAPRRAARPGQEGAGNRRRRYRHGCRAHLTPPHRKPDHHRLPAHARGDARQPGGAGRRARGGQHPGGAGLAYPHRAGSRGQGHSARMPAQRAGRARPRRPAPTGCDPGQRIPDPVRYRDRRRGPEARLRIPRGERGDAV